MAERIHLQAGCRNRCALQPRLKGAPGFAWLCDVDGRRPVRPVGLMQSRICCPRQGPVVKSGSCGARACIDRGRFVWGRCERKFRAHPTASDHRQQ